MSKQEFLEFFFNPDENGISRWISREELKDTPLSLGNNGHQRKGTFFGNKKYKWETIRPKKKNGRVQLMETNSG